MILVTGYKGFLAARVFKALSEKHQVWGVDKKTDITNYNEIKNLFEKIRPELVVHCAAIGDIWRCEEDNDLAVKVNIIGTRNLASLCGRYDSRMIFISSDQVYNYYGTGNLREYMRPEPTNFYGITKKEGEAEVGNLVPKHHIIRLSWQYGWHEEGLPDSRDGQLEHIRYCLKTGRKIEYTPNSRQNITYVYDTVDAMVTMAEMSIPFGIYNVASENSMTEYERIAYILGKFGINDEKVQELTVAKAAAPFELLTEPYYLKMAGYKMPTFEEGLNRCFRELVREVRL